MSFESAAEDPLRQGADLSAKTQILTIDLEDWHRGTVDLWRLDREADRLGARGPLAFRFRYRQLDDLAATRAARQIVFRCQRWSGARGPHTTPVFDELRRRHRALHDHALPLVVADYAHAIDTWQWILRLSPDASLALQAAALLHDVERLSSESTVRIEHRAADYAAFKQAHAQSGASTARALLDEVGFSPADADRAASLIARHDGGESRSGDAELELLEDADGLSFFALNAAGFVQHFDASHTRRKVAFTLARMSARARARLPLLWLPAEVEAVVANVSRARGTGSWSKL